MAADGCRHGSQRKNTSLGLKDSNIAITIASPARYEEKSSQRVCYVPKFEVGIRYLRNLYLKRN